MEGRERLRILSAVMGPGTRDLLAEVGIPPGSSCLDVGCGGGDVTVELARAAGSSGRAVGVDLDRTILEIKFTERFPTWVSDIVQWLDLQRASVPK